MSPAVRLSLVQGTLALCLSRVLLAVLIAASLPGAACGAQHGRFLPDLLPNSIVLGWGKEDPTQFDKEVFDPVSGTKVGEIHFDQDKFVSLPDFTLGPQGGAALAGGFYLNEGAQVKEGFELHWLQTVTATRTGQNVWNLPTSAAGEFPDVNNAANPIYSQETLPENVTPPAEPGKPSLAFQDFPQRFFRAGAQTWMAELGLVALATQARLEIDDMMFHEARVVASLRWGFSLPNPQEPFDTDDVTAVAPANWGAPQESYVKTLNAFYDGMGGGGGAANNGAPVASGKYRFFTGRMVFVPEPATAFLLAWALVLSSLKPRTNRSITTD